MRAGVSPVLAFASASDELLSAILDQSPDCIKVLSLDGRIDYMNRAGQCAMEIEEFGTVVGRPWASLWPEMIRPVVLEALETARTAGEAQFSAFCPTAKNSPKWWDVSVKALNMRGAFSGYVSVSHDITARVQAQEASDAIAAEMRHRLRNAYQVAGGLMHVLARGVPEREAFARDMAGRLASLGAAQTVQDQDGAAGLAALVGALVSPYATPDCAIEIGAMPAARLDQRQLDALAMVFGELAVNSTKHGALSTHGHIRVDGADEGGGRLSLCWSERSERPVTARERRGGNGMLLMKRIMGSCAGDISFAWRTDGLDATVTLNAPTLSR